jgi:uncharacterized protein (DUF1499 family)
MGEEKTEAGIGQIRAPRLAVAAILLALVALLTLMASGLGTRLGLWQFRTGFTILKYGGFCGIVAGIVAITAAVVYLRKRRILGVFLALVALCGGIVAIALPMSWKSLARKVPPIHDISTDTINPPRFVAILPLRQGAPNVADYAGPAVALLQRTAYPDIQPLVVNLPFQQAFDAAEKGARSMGWRIVATAPAEGRIEATATTFWFGFIDDVVVRLTPAGERTIVDVRSVSRVGISDVGTNARRIRAYLKIVAGMASG